jgi:hypothetical protein
MAKGDIHIDKDHDAARVRVVEELASGRTARKVSADGTVTKAKRWTVGKLKLDAPLRPPQCSNPRWE